MVANKPLIDAQVSRSLKTQPPHTTRSPPHPYILYTHMSAQVKPLLRQYMPQMADVDFASPRVTSGVRGALEKAAAQLEMYHGLYLVAELALPSRNVMNLIVWWQFMQMHYMMLAAGQVEGYVKENHLRAAFADMDVRVSGLVAHPRCPQVVGRAYGMLKKFLADTGAPPSPPSSSGSGGGGGGGLMSRCTIS